MKWFLKQVSRLNGGRSPKLITVYLVMSTILVLVSLLLYLPSQYLYAKHIISKDITEIDQKNLWQAQSRFQTHMSEMEQYLKNLLHSETLQNLFSAADQMEGYSAETHQAIQNLNNHLARVKNAYDDISKIELITQTRVYSSSSNETYNKLPGLTYDKIMHTEAISKKMSVAEEVVFFEEKVQSENQDLLCFFVACLDIQRNSPAYLVFQMKESWVRSSLQTNRGTIGLYESDSLELIFASDELLKQNEYDLNFLRSDQNGTSFIELDNQPYDVTWQKLNNYGFIFVIFQNLTDLLLPLNRMRRYAVAAVLCSLLFSMFFITILSRRALRDLNNLQDMAQSYVQKGVGQLLPLKYKARSLNEEISFSLFLVMALPVILFSLLFHSLTVSILNSSKEDLISLALDQQTEQVLSFIKWNKSLTERLMFDQTIQTLMKSNNEQGLCDLERLQQAVSDNIMISEPFSLYYYDESGKPIFTNQLDRHSYIPQIGELEKNSFGEMIFSITPDDQASAQPFGFIRKIKNLAISEQMGMQTIGYLACYYHKSVISGIIDHPFYGHIYLYDCDGRLLYSDTDTSHNSADEITLKADLHERKLSDDQPDVSFQTSAGGDSMAYVRLFGRQNWVMVLLIDRAFLNTDRSFLIFFNISAMLLFCVLSFFISRFLSGYTFKPIISLIEHILQSDPATFSQYPEATFFPNELNELIFAFNQMATQVIKLYNVESEKNRMELWALQSQINPHFMYNTFESIRWLNKGNDRASIDKMIGYLRELFRVSMSSETQMITLKEEIVHAQAYVNIQKMRYGNQLNDSWQIDPETENILVPRLILQPLIENAINHGVRELEDKAGLIQIKNMMKNDKLVLSVSDNGPGLTVEQKDLLMERLTQTKIDHRSGIGLINVYRRLSLYYPSCFDMNIQSIPYQETTITLIIPTHCSVNKDPKKFTQ